MTQPLSRRVVTDARLDALVASHLQNVSSATRTTLTGLPVSSHTHALGDVTGLQNALDALPTLGEIEASFPLNSRTKVLVPTAVTYEAIQTALTGAKGTGDVVVIGGVISTDQTLTIECNCDLSRLRIEYTGTGTAVRVGNSTSITQRLSAKLPYVRNMKKTGNGWASVAGSVGVELINLNSCYDVAVPGIRNFEIGLLDIGTNAQGHVYNAVTLGQLENNMRNHVIRSIGVGWANENLYIGGRFSHYSNEGVRIPGVKHIEVETADGNSVNNNVWIRPAVEGIANEYAFDCNGVYNMVLSGRWESSDDGARVRWGAQAKYNTILGGYATHRIVANISYSNAIIAPHRFEFPGGGDTGGVQFMNSSSASSPAWQILDTINGVTNADWTWQASATEIRGRRSTEPHPRIIISALNGQITFGNGQSAPATRIAQYGTSRSFMVSANLRFLQEADVGEIGSVTHPASNIFASGKLYLNGTYLRNSSGVLEASPDGTAGWTPYVLGTDSRLTDARTPTTHTHTTAQITGLDAALSAKLDQAAVDARVQTGIDALVGAAPEALNTLNELATALGNDPNFATTITNQIAGKADAVHAHALGDVTGLQAALDGKAATTHSHTVSQITATGTAGATTFLRGDGSWQVPVNTTYALMTQAVADTGTATTANTINAAVLKGAIWQRVTGSSTTAVTTLGQNLNKVADAAAARTLLGAASDADPRLSDSRTPNAHTHLWADITDKPTSLAPTAHTHTVSEVTGLQSQLDGKASTTHTHERMDAAPALWEWTGTSLPTSASQVHNQARVGDMIAAKNLSSDPGIYKITGV